MACGAGKAWDFSLVGAVIFALLVYNCLLVLWELSCCLVCLYKSNSYVWLQMLGLLWVVRMDCLLAPAARFRNKKPLKGAFCF